MRYCSSGGTRKGYRECVGEFVRALVWGDIPVPTGGSLFLLGVWGGAGVLGGSCMGRLGLAGGGAGFAMFTVCDFYIINYV